MQRARIDKKRIAPSILTALVLPTAMWTVAFEIYCNSRGEFLFSAWAFLPILLALSLVVASLVAVLLLFLPPLAYRIVRNVWLILGFLFFLQSIYLNRGLSSFTANGTTGGTAKFVGNAILWAVLLAAAVGVAFWRDGKGIGSTVCLVLSVVVLAAQGAGYVSNTIKHTDAYADRKVAGETVERPKLLTTRNLVNLGTGHTILYFCFDRFDEYFAECAYARDPHVYDGLEGFTAYTDYMSLYGYTYPSVAFMLTNRVADPAKTRTEVLRAAYEKEETLSLLAAHGYGVDVYTQPYYGYDENSAWAAPVDNIGAQASVHVDDPWRISARLLQMGLYRGAPYVLKGALGTIDVERCNRNVTCRDDSGEEGYDCVRPLSKRRRRKLSYGTQGENVFKFIHTKGLHECMAPKTAYDASKSHRGDGKAVEVVRDCMDIVRGYISALKALGADAYRNATIIVTGDHATPNDQYGELTYAKQTALLIKPSGVSEDVGPQGGVAFSSAPLSNADIWHTILQDAGIKAPSSYAETYLYDCAGRSVYEVASDPASWQTRKRAYRHQTWRTDGKTDVYDYVITGSGRDFSHWTLANAAQYPHGIMY